MSKQEAQCIWPLGAQLGEGPLWMAQQNRLYFVDLKGCALHALDLADGQRHRWDMPDYICWLVPRRDGDGFMAGLRDGIVRLWLEPQVRIEYVARPFAEGSGLRMNDAKADSTGRIWAGSMHNTDYAQAAGRLFRLEPDQSLSVADHNYHICNGPALSRDGATLYHTDSYEGRIYAYPLAADGTLGEPRLWRQFEGDEGAPDGMTVDSEGCLWIAQWGGGRVCRYAPDATLLETVTVAARNPASCTLGGPDLRTLYITTACEDNTPEQLQAYPLSGALFAARVAVPGVAAYRYG
ncbi:SMP-30/gluconolactonase/LRE family protein [Pseudoduganella danionis]|uniref:SMP-30/gluconolactonase/LRE family protein n=1 Tax=Pseudoduganella danionis TaxID=1890295 RepID=A0ABW9SIM6_9BURK|nr:SMP-30/gluconolactonase/LRE family protein [Pseudoduganella danionis]MTW31795.1 SMP-30/gluconolactonase/LRE family protein [Pseudoduganella danionis]